MAGWIKAIRDGVGREAGCARGRSYCSSVTVGMEGDLGGGESSTVTTCDTGQGSWNLKAFGYLNYVCGVVRVQDIPPSQGLIRQSTIESTNIFGWKQCDLANINCSH